MNQCKLISLQPPNNQVEYTATGDQIAVQYFDVDKTSGKVLVKQPLYTGTASQYNVSACFAESSASKLH